MQEFDPSKCLPPELTIESVDDILYRIGLCLTSVRDRPKRPKLFHPLIAFTYVLIFTIKEVFVLFLISLSSENKLLLAQILDFHVIRAEGYCSGCVILTAILSLSSQLIYYNNYRKGIEPTFLHVFQMMSGLVPPKSLGLSDEAEIRKLVSKTKTLVKYMAINNKSILPLTQKLLVIAIYLNNGWSMFWAIPNSIFYMIMTIYAVIIITTQLLVFYIICSYLKLKINALNKSLSEMRERKDFSKIGQMFQTFDSLNSEINEYNDTFWSKFLGVFWQTFGVYLVIVLYCCLFAPISIYIKIICVYILAIWGTLFLFIIFTASSVTYSVNKSYLILNALFVCYSRPDIQYSQLYYTRISTKIKVYIYLLINLLRFN